MIIYQRLANVFQVCAESQSDYTDLAWLSLTNERKFVDQQQQIN